MKRLIWLRRSAQILVLALFCILPWLNSLGFHGIKGSLFAFEAAGIPFADPASAAQAVASGGAGGAAPLLLFYTGALLTLAIAFFCGRAFCGWLCPYGLFSELVFKMRMSPYKKRRDFKRIFLIKAGLFLAALTGAALLAYPLLSLLSMPGQISLIPLALYDGAIYGAVFSLLVLPLSALLGDALFGQRFWCVNVCPQSVLLGVCAQALPKSAPGLRINWSAAKCDCGKTSPCKSACSLGLNPRQKNGPSRRDCIMCGDCVQACSHFGKALRFKII